VSTAEHRDLATRVSADGMVLLKNDHRALPLSEHAPRSVAVIGPSGDDAVYISGGSSAVPAAAGADVTPLAGITARAGSGVRVTSSQGSLGDAPLPAVVPSSVLTPSSGSGAGLLGEYWSNGEQDGAPAVTRVDPTVDLAAAPAGVGLLWSARWTGTLTPGETGLYRFSLMQAGIARLFVDGREIASGYREGVQFIAGPRYPTSSGAVVLRAGKPVSVRIEYTSKANLFGAQVHFSWQPPSASQIAGAVAAARGADAAVVIANVAQGEGMDRSTLALPGDQDALIEAVAAVNRRTIVVLNTGGPVLMPWLGRVAAVLQAWYPGQQFGTALAGVLWGDSDPGGRLPVTFPASDQQGPAPPTRPELYPGVNGQLRYDEGIFVGYRWYDQFRRRPLFEFGYGMSYARFRFDGLRVVAGRDGNVLASVRVSNVSDRVGSTVAQAYVGFPSSSGEPPQQLKGYEKVRLAPHRSTRVSFRLGPDELSYFDAARGRMVVAGGRYTLSVGSTSRDLSERESFELGRHRHR
jgi:beta-glucosidase